MHCKRKVQVLLSSFVFLLSYTAHSQWVRVGLTNRDVTAIWAKGDTLLAGCDSGRIFRSTDVGMNWTQTTTNMPRNNLVLSFLDTNGVIYSAAGYTTFGTCNGCGGVFRSTDRGIIWESINSGFPRDIQVQTIFPQGNKLFAGADAGLFSTQANNISWTRVDSSLADVYFILSSTIKNQEIYIGSDLYGIYRSNDNGVSWTRFSLGLPRYADSSYYPIGAMTTAGDTVYAAVSSAGVYQISPASSIWKAVNAGLSGFENLFVSSFTETSANIFASTIRRVYYLPRGDSVWNDFSQGLNLPFPGSSISMIYKNDQYLFAGIQGFGSGVWRRHQSEIVSVEEQTNGNPIEKPSLEQNYPNPFNAETTIRFLIPNNSSSEATFVSVKVYDVLGREVRVLIETRLLPGAYVVRLDGRDLSSGLYLCRLRIDEFVSSKRLLLLR